MSDASFPDTRSTEDALRRRVAQQALLLSVTREMVLADDETSLARVVFEAVGPHLDADVCFNYRLDEDGQRLVLAAGFGIPADRRADAQSLRLGQAFCGTAAATLQPVVADAKRIAEDAAGAFVRGMGVRAYACHPLLSRNGQLLGTMSLASTRRDTFDALDVEFLQTLCHSMALAWERMRADEARRASDERLRLLVDGVNDFAIYMLDLDGRVVTWNSGAERLKGYRAEEIVGQHVSRFYTPEDVSARRPDSNLRTALDSGHLDEEGWRVRKDGSRFWAQVAITPVRNAAGALVGLAKVTRDLTERRQAEEALASQQGFLRTIVHVVIDGIITMGDDGLITSVNAATERIFGYAEAEMLGRNVKMLMPEPYYSAHDSYLANYARTGQPRIIGIGREVEGRRKDGTVFPMELSVAEFHLDGQRHYAGVVRDITERRSIEGQLRQAQKMDAFGQLAGGVAHDFNNLLTVISGASELLAGELPAQDGSRELVTAISDAAGRAAALTRQLLAFSRQTVLAPEVLDVNEVVVETERLLRRLIGEDIVLATTLAPELRLVRADRGLLGQVLMNLAVNARDAMPRGGRLTVETANVSRGHDRWTHDDLAPGNYVSVAMTDTGTGMPPDVQARIFEPFFTTKSPGKGTGLGLSVVLGILKQSGGTVHVYSEPGVGTCFRLYFPAVDDAARRQDVGVVQHAPHGTETVLLAEDEDDVRELATLALQSHGYHVLAARGGAEAVELALAHKGPIAILVTDVVMPGMDGRELATTIQAARPGLRVLFLSGYTDDAVVRHGILHHQVAYLQKPYSLLGLARKVREVIDA